MHNNNQRSRNSDSSTIETISLRRQSSISLDELSLETDEDSEKVSDH
jgi:hypothetical protein